MTLSFNGINIGGTSGGQTIRNQDKTITTNGEYTADTGYTGLGTVTVEVEGGATTEELTVTPTTSTEVYTPSTADAYSKVTVNGVTSAIDENITASNIKSGVSILGVSGSVVELNGETKTVNPSTSSQTITPTSPKNAITSVTVNAVTSSIDNNIVAGNIKSGVEILGVTGNYTGSSANIESLSVTPSTSAQTITASGGVDGYSPISVSAVTSSIDANITAGNIKKDVTILGVTGSFEGGTTPTGTINITSNGTKDVTNYATANVNVQPTLSDNIAVVGSLTNNNGVISGFSNANYVQLPLKFNPVATSWEQKFKFTTSNDCDTNQRITSSATDMKSGANILIWNYRIDLWMTSTGSSWNIASDKYTNQFIQPNTTYYIKLKCEKGASNYTYTLNYSTDDVTYNTGVTVTSALYVNSTEEMRIGSGSDNLPMKGSIDLSGCYIKVNGVYIWQGRVLA